MAAIGSFKKGGTLPLNTFATFIVCSQHFVSLSFELCAPPMRMLLDAALLMAVTQLRLSFRRTALHSNFASTLSLLARARRSPLRWSASAGMRLARLCVCILDGVRRCLSLLALDAARSTGAPLATSRLPLRLYSRWGVRSAAARLFALARPMLLFSHSPRWFICRAFSVRQIS